MPSWPIIVPLEFLCLDLRKTLNLSAPGLEILPITCGMKDDSCAVSEWPDFLLMPWTLLTTLKSSSRNSLEGQARPVRYGWYGFRTNTPAIH